MSKFHLSERRLKPLARAIERREAELRREIAEERERANSEGFSEIAESTGDAVDKAFARVRSGIEYQRIDGHLAEIRELAAARQRMESGIFGSCVDCGEPIDPARLDAYPAAARCALCQDRYERARVMRH
jgi:DnaK suppressor protein